MEIVLRRIAKQKEYTIGRLYLLDDAEVKRKALPGKKKWREAQVCKPI